MTEEEPPPPAQQQQQAPAAGAVYTCVKRAIIRDGKEASSAKVGLLQKGEVVTVLEEAVSADGVQRVRFDRGWTSVVPSLELVGEAPAPASDSERTSPGARREAKELLSGMSLQERLAMAQKDHEARQQRVVHTDEDFHSLEGRGDVKKTAAATEGRADTVVPPLIPAPAATAAQSPVVYRCIKRLVVRSGIAADSERVGLLKADDTITVEEEAVSAEGIRRVRFALGWTSVTAPDGSVALELVSGEAPQADDTDIASLLTTVGPPASPRTSAGIDTEPVREHQAPAAGAVYTCVKRAIIRDGKEASSAKVGLLQKGEVVTVLEEAVSADGVQRVRFDRGWTSVVPSLELVGDSPGTSDSPGARREAKELLSGMSLQERLAMAQKDHEARQQMVVHTDEDFHSLEGRGDVKKTAAATEGRADTVVPPLIPAPAATAAQSPVVYRCIKRLVVRSGIAADSERVGLLKADDTITVEEEAVSAEGIRRVRFALGWTSVTAPDGSVALELVSGEAPQAGDASVGEPAPEPVPEPESQADVEPAPRERAATSDSASDPAPPPSIGGMVGQADVSKLLSSDDEAEPADVVAPPPVPAPAATAAQSPVVYRCIKRLVVRSGIAADSERVGLLKADDTITVEEEAVSAEGIRRVRFALGWTSVTAPDGSVALELVSGEAPQAGDASVGEPAPEPVPEPESQADVEPAPRERAATSDSASDPAPPPSIGGMVGQADVSKLLSSDDEAEPADVVAPPPVPAPAATAAQSPVVYRCIKRLVVRSGIAADSERVGLLKADDTITVEEEAVSAEGIRRVRFALGWTSVTAPDGSVALELVSGEAPQAGDASVGEPAPEPVPEPESQADVEPAPRERAATSDSASDPAPPPSIGGMVGQADVSKLLSSDDEAEPADVVAPPPVPAPAATAAQSPVVYRCIKRLVVRSGIAADSERVGLLKADDTITVEEEAVSAEGIRRVRFALGWTSVTAPDGSVALELVSGEAPQAGDASVGEPAPEPVPEPESQADVEPAPRERAATSDSASDPAPPPSIGGMVGQADVSKLLSSDDEAEPADVVAPPPVPAPAATAAQSPVVYRCIKRLVVRSGIAADSERVGLLKADDTITVEEEAVSAEGIRRVRFALGWTSVTAPDGSVALELVSGEAPQAGDASVGEPAPEPVPEPESQADVEPAPRERAATSDSASDPAPPPSIGGMVGQADVSKLLSSDDEAEPAKAVVLDARAATSDSASDPAPPPSIGGMVGQADVSKLLSSDDEAEPAKAVVLDARAATSDSASDPAPPPSIGGMVGQADVSKLLSSDDEAEPAEAVVLDARAATSDSASDPAPPPSIGGMVGQADVSKLLSSDDEADPADVVAPPPIPAHSPRLMIGAQPDALPDHMTLDVAAAARAEAEAAGILAAAAAAAEVAAADAAAAEAAVAQAAAAVQISAAEAVNAVSAELAASEDKSKADAAVNEAVEAAAFEARQAREMVTAAAGAARSVSSNSDDDSADDEAEQEWETRSEELSSQGWVQPPADFDELDDLVGAQLYVQEHGYALLLNATRNRKSAGWKSCKVELEGSVQKTLVLRARGREYGLPFLYILDGPDKEEKEDCVQWRALQQCVVRAGVERTTEALGNLTVNEIFDQLERFVTEDGVVRVRCARGWVSVTASDGFPLCVREDSIQKLLASVPLLQALSDEEREEIAKALGYEAYDYDEPIVKQGDDGDHMYFLEEGQAQADVDGVMVMAYTVGDYFGELALLGNAPRQATVTATGPSGARCLVLGREAFDLIAAKNAKSLAAQRRRYQTRTHGRSDSAAPAVSLPEDSPVQWRALQQCLVRAGVERTTEALGNLTVNEIFDQLERFVTEDGVVRVRCARGWVSVTASDGFPLCVREDSIQKLLASVPLLQALSDEEREEIAKALGYEAYDYDEPIVKQGDDGDHMYFLEEGQAQADVDGVMVMAYTVGDYFGELALLGNAPRQATVTATGPSGARCLVLGREAFDLIAAKNAKSLAAQRRRYQTRTHGRSDSAAPAVAKTEQMSIEAKLTASPVLSNGAAAAFIPMSSPMPVPPATPRTQMTVNEHMALAEKYYASDRLDDRQRALHHFKVAASLGDTIGRRSLAIMYEHGEGGPVDLALALHYYQLAAAAGDLESDYSAGEILLSEVVEKGVDAAADQFEEAMMHFQRAAEREHPGAMYHLAQMIIFCLDGCGTAAADTAADSAVNLLSQAAESGHSAAERELGTCLFHGVGVDQDLAAAVAHYRSASAAGDAAATYTLGWRYFKGEGTARSLPEAERCFADAAALGHAEAAKAVAHVDELRRLFDEHSVQSPRVSTGKVGKIWDEFWLGRGIAAAAANANAASASPTRAHSLQGVGEDWRVQAARPRVKQA